MIKKSELWDEYAYSSVLKNSLTFFQHSEIDVLDRSDKELVSSLVLRHNALFKAQYIGCKNLFAACYFVWLSWPLKPSYTGILFHTYSNTLTGNWKWDKLSKERGSFDGSKRDNTCSSASHKKISTLKNELYKTKENVLRKFDSETSQTESTCNPTSV